MKDYKQWLVERFIIERKRFDRSGVYAYTQRAMAYNSNKIEGSTLTPADSQDKITYKTSNKKIATVSKTGKIKAKKKGKVKITVISGKKKAVCTVKVK